MKLSFPLDQVPFSYHGSWMSLCIIPRENGELFFRNHHARPNNLFTLRLVADGQILSPSIEATPSALTLTTDQGAVEICFENPDSIRMRGRGVGLQLAGQRIHAYRNGPNMAVFNLRKAFRRYQFECLHGIMGLKGAYAAPQEDLENLAELHGAAAYSNKGKEESPEQTLLVATDEDGCWEIAVDEFWSSWERPERASFDHCLTAAKAAFDRFLEHMPQAPDELAEPRALAAYIDWSCTVNPCGRVKRPTLFMSKNWMNNVWSWDQCFNAMALASGEPELALDQMLTLVDHQDRFGAYPDAFNDMEIHYNFSKPPVHGWAFAEMLKRLPKKPSTKLMEILYNSLSLQANWWMSHRVLAKDGGTAAPDGGKGQLPAGEGFKRLPYYLHGNDSGWDNSTMFAQGVPLVAPDLSALLIVQMDTLTGLAAELGKTEEAVSWKSRAERLFKLLMDELWTGERFVARRGIDGAPVASQSLIPWLPIILGERLPSQVRAQLSEGIKGHLTDWGLATEKPDSPDYIEDGYWRGPIWAPSTYLAVAGLDRAGHSELADTIAERFCRLCQKSGFAENYNALTGESLRDPAYTWTASVFLLLAERLKKQATS